MEFRLLGPLEVWHGGQQLALGGAKQRALLAALLLRANQVVPADRLIDDLWGDQPPGTAANVLQGYVAGLRKALEPGRARGAGHEVLLTRPGGYLVRVGDDALDIQRFERLAEHGREALAVDPVIASARLREGLALWRGPVLADVADEAFAQSEIRRLEECRVQALEDRLEADLAMGRHTDVIPELEALVTEHPLRERLRGQLMLALYRADRQAEACDVYHRGRAILNEELGMAPSPALQQLLTAILNQDASLTPPLRVPSSELDPQVASTPPVLHNLPAEVTSFVGRERELKEVEHLLTGARLVTLTGAGGSGKTRLGLRAAAHLLLDYPDGVWVVELAPLAEQALVPQAVAAVLGIREQPPATINDTLLEWLRPKRLLILLDNCEHLIGSCAELAYRMLLGCPQLRILATSREPLNIDGEVAWRVPVLSLPEAGATPAIDTLGRYAAIRLFVERAAAGMPSFALCADNAAAVTLLCRRLDGIPLAIELAAARVRAISPEEILDRLDNRFRLLTAGTRSAVARQQTLRATVDWSHELLDPDERTLFRRLAVFVGGWRLDQAEGICADEALPANAILELLARLVDKSLVLAEPNVAGSTRYRMLETLRDYASERLRAAGEETGLRGRHFRWFLDLTETVYDQRMATGSDARLTVLEADHDNLRAALGWSRDADPQGALALAGALYDLWLAGNVVEGRRWLADMLAQTSDGSGARARGLIAAGQLAMIQQSHGESRELLEAGLDLAVGQGNPVMESWARTTLGLLAWMSEDLAGARTHLERSVPLHEALGDRFGTARSLIYLGLTTCFAASLDQGRPGLERGLDLARQVGDTWGEGLGLIFLGIAEIDAGERAAAESRFRAALAMRMLGPILAGPLDGLAELTCDKDPERAMRLSGAADSVRLRKGGVRPAILVRRVKAVRARIEQRLGPAAAERAREEGRQMTAEEAVAYALKR